MQYLEEWAVIDHGHCSSLAGATESLKASIIRLPVVGGARVSTVFILSPNEIVNAYL